MVGHKLRLLIDERRATSGIWNPGSACLMSLGLKAICHLLFGWPTPPSCINFNFKAPDNYWLSTGLSDEADSRL